MGWVRGLEGGGNWKWFRLGTELDLEGGADWKGRNAGKEMWWGWESGCCDGRESD